MPFLDRLADEGAIAFDWIAGLRSCVPHIDVKLEICAAKLAGSGRYLPQDQDDGPRLWRAFELPLSEVRVLALGQDPYPDASRATGLSFSTGPGGDIPASLANIFRELPAGCELPHSGDLTPWTTRGVMLLNRALTLPNEPCALPKRHIRWWAPLASATMQAIRVEAATRPIAAMLWGVPALTVRKHLEPDVMVFASSHPSPRSARRPAGGEPPFRGSDPFGKVNRWLVDQGDAPIDWTLSG